MVEIQTRSSALLDTKYWEFFVPTILMAMTLTMSVVVDAIMVGNMLGAQALAAVNLVMPLIMTYNTVAVCLGLGAATLISIAKGRREPETANQVFTTVLVALVFLGSILLGIQLLLTENITALLTREVSLRPLVQAYVQMLVYGTPFIILVPGLAHCLRVDAKVKLASTVLIVSNLVNLVLDYVYMGPLQFGIGGSSLATVCGYLVGGGFLLIYVFSPTRSLRFLPEALCLAPDFLRRLATIVKTGFPAAIGSILITFKILCINHIVLAVAGTSGMVAFSVCLSCLSFVSMFISGAAQAMTPIVGVLFGERDYLGIFFVVRRAFITLMVASLGATILLELFPVQVLALFGVHHGADLAEGIPAIRLFSLSLIGTSTTFLTIYFYMTTGRTKLSTAVAILQGASVVPLAFVLSKLFGISGIWVAFSLAELLTLAMIAACFLSLKIRFPKRYDSILLLDQDELPPGLRLELTTPRPLSGQALEQIEAFLLTQQDTAQLTPRIIAILKTLLQNRPATDAETSQSTDIRINLLDETIITTLREQGCTLIEDEGLIQSLQTSCGFQQAQAIGFTNTILTFARA